MNLIQQLLSESLTKINPQLNLQGSDKRILRIASQDLTNYLMFRWKPMGQEITQPEITERIRTYLHEKHEELKEFLKIWTKNWMKKWNERVKIVPETEEPRHLKKTHERLRQVEPIWRQLRNRSEIKGMVIETLIRYGEIFGTSILAEHLIKTELASYIERKSYGNRIENDLLDITNRALTRARQLSRNKGTTIFIITRKSRLM